MCPAFSSTKSAAAFALLLLLLLVLPVVVGKNLLPSREQSYETLSWGSGPYPWIQHEIFEEKGDIDILFIGSSHILHCLDARYLQDQLSKKLGHPAVVRVMGWGGSGYDALYFITQALLQHRKVKLLVFYNENNEASARNTRSPAWFRLADGAETLHGLPLIEQSYLYFAAVVGMPRNLLAAFCPNLPADLHTTPPNNWEEHYRSTNLADNLGSTSSELGFDTRPKPDADPTAPFFPYAPKMDGQPEAMVYSPATQTNFQFTSTPLPVWQIHFAQLFLAMARQQDVRLVLLHIPMLDEARTPAIQERTFWQENSSDNLLLLGVPPLKMFSGLTDDEVRKMYANPGDMNKNGQEYFTRLITPALMKIYETTTH